ncbi:MAG: hemerythrin domain-containing protein [Bacteroidales bacterium]|jgi:regulator of cell morphogenesis and NO signaling
MKQNFKYQETDKVYDLISENYFLLSIFSRFGIPLGFGDKNIKQICEENKVDLNTFLIIVNLLSNPNFFKTTNQVLESLNLKFLIKFLNKSHDYFLNYKFSKIRSELEKALIVGDKPTASVIMKYYDEYVEEVNNHMMYEETTVFIYVNDLLSKKKMLDYNIDIFKKNHDQVESKLQELTSIIIKYYNIDNTNALYNILFDIFVCAEDLKTHNIIEDNLFVPAVELLEQQINNTI